MNFKKKLPIILFLCILILFFLNFFKFINFQNFFNNNISDSEVTIITDKTVYQEGEEIIISITNNSNSSIYYSPGGDRVWDIEYFKGEKWINLYNFQVSDQEIGRKCSLPLYERIPVAELKSNIKNIDKWNQMYCQINSGEFSGLVSFLDEGKYRVSFRYGLRITSKDPFDKFAYEIKDENIAYSEPFSVE